MPSTTFITPLLCLFVFVSFEDDTHVLIPMIVATSSLLTATDGEDMNTSDGH